MIDDYFPEHCCCVFNAKFEDDSAFEIDFGEFTTIGAEYTGDYSVTPSIYAAQTLPTKNRRLSDDITVAKIPTYEVSNASGGATLVIGNESMNV